MRARNGLAIFAVASVVLSCGPQWQTIRSEEGGFTVELPGSPEPFQNILASASGPLRFQGFRFTAGRWTPNWIAAYMVTFSDVIEDRGPESREQLLRAERDQIVEGWGGKATTEKASTLSGCPGLAVAIERPSKKNVEVHVCYARGRIYSLFAADAPERVTRFLGSFRVE
jgi:hypothetical protein